MRILNSLYPYPVLSLDDNDYRGDSIFKIDYTLQEATAFKPAKLLANFDLVNSQIEELIKQDKAGLFIQVESPRAIYRELHPVKNQHFELEINTDYMRSFVEVTGFVLATETVRDFKNKDVNSDLYGADYVFPILNPGDPLAVAFTIELSIEDTNDFTQVASIIKVAQTTDELMKIDYDQDTILVYLPVKQYQSYVTYHGNFDEVMLSAIIQPALIYVLDAVAKNKGTGMEAYKWYRVIEKKLEELNYSMNQLFNDDVNSVLLAQKILKNPLDRMFTELEGMINEDGEN